MKKNFFIYLFKHSFFEKLKMGAEHFKKKLKYSDMLSSNPKIQNRLSEGISNKHSNILNDLKEDNEINDNNGLIKSKTDSKLSETAKNEEEKAQIKRERKITMDNLKSLSTQNLVKIIPKEDSSEENKNIINQNENNNNPQKTENDLKEETDNDKSLVDEDYEEEEEEKEEEDEKNDEKKKNELMVPNNMKKVFIDSRAKSNINSENKKTNEKPSILIEEEKNKNQNLIQNNNNTSSSTITANDYELNFYRNGIDIRQSYLSKLLTTKVWTPNMKPKKHNCIIIFDWDDTLLPTTFLTKGGSFYEDTELTPSDQKKISELENLVLELLTETLEKGSVYIITNAGLEWVNYSSKRFYPKIIPILDKIKIVSARGEYEKAYPGNSRQWKIEAFLMLQNSVDVKLVTNIICLGDSLFEMEAGRILASRFTEAFIKTIKFREAPKLDELIKQLKLVCKQFSSIYSSIKNLTIRVERKKK